MQTLLVGLDAACASVVDPLVDSGAVPTIAELSADGYAGDLESQIPPWTPSAWPSIYTGVNPGKHGVYGFLKFEGYQWDVVDRTDVREHAIWELLDRHGYSSVVVNVPVTHPAREIDGAVVPGYVAPENPDCVPADALDSFDDYRIYPQTDDDSTRDALVREFEALVAARGEVFRTLAERHDPDFGFLQFQGTDTVFHELPGDEAAVERVYRTVDDELAAVLETCEPRNVVLVSDHGMGRYDGYEFRVNEFLSEQGYVTRSRGGRGMPSWDSIARNQLQNGTDGGQPDRGALERAAALAARAGLTSQRIQSVLSTVGIAEYVARVAPTDAIRAATEQVDFQQSTAFMRDRIELGIRLNVVDRDPDGVVPQSEYEQVRSEIIVALQKVQTPDGDPVFETVAPREAVFHGPYLDEAPDIVCVPAAFDHFLSGALLGEQFGSPRETWNHKRAGLIVASGPDLSPAAMDGATTPSLFDVAPTVLSLYDVPVSDRMDGTPLALVQPTDSHSYPDFDAREIRSPDSDTVEQHLADLGYLEDV